MVDENSTGPRILSTPCEKQGLRPTPFQTGRKALNRLSTGEIFDGAILNMLIPEIDGMMLARNDPAASPVVIATGPTGET